MEVIDAKGNAVAAEDLLEDNSGAQSGTMANVHGLGAVAQATHKVSLERYRAASRRIFAVFTDLVGEHCVEKASIDEAFLDMTALVDTALQGQMSSGLMQAAHDCAVRNIAVQGANKLKRHASLGQDPAADAPPHGEVPTGENSDIRHWLPAPPSSPLPQCSSSQQQDSNTSASPPLHDWCIAWPVHEGDSSPPHAAALLPGADADARRLLLAAHVAATCRREVWRRLGFTCSAGVAHNKLLAKLASARNKPNQQTLVPLACVRPLMGSMPLGSLRQLGGKLGALVAKKWSVGTAGELLRVPYEELLAALGEKTGPWLWGLVRGQCDEAVRVGRTATKSMLAAKSFRAAQGQDLAAVASWVRMLASDLALRMVADAAQSARSPRTLSVYWRRADIKGQGMRSKSGPMPPRTRVAGCEITAWREQQQLGGGAGSARQAPTDGDSDASTDIDEDTEVTHSAADCSAAAQLDEPDSGHEAQAGGAALGTPARRLQQRVHLLEAAAMSLLSTVPPREIVPCTRLALAAGSFSETAVAQGQKRLGQFFGAAGGDGQPSTPAAQTRYSCIAQATVAATVTSKPGHMCPPPRDEVGMDMVDLASPTVPFKAKQYSARIQGSNGAPPAEQSWVCAACTLLNAGDKRLCGACGAWAPNLRAAGGVQSSAATRPSQPSLGRWLGRKGSGGGSSAVRAPRTSGPPRVQAGGIARFLGNSSLQQRSKLPKQ